MRKAEGGLLPGRREEAAHVRSDVGGGSRYSPREEEATSAPVEWGVGLGKVRGGRLPAVRVRWAWWESKGRSRPTRGFEGTGSLHGKA